MKLINYYINSFSLIFLISLLFNCATNVNNTNGITLKEAIEQSADQITVELPARTRIAIVAFTSENEKLSDFIMDEIAIALHNRRFEIANRQSLEYVRSELNFQLSGEVSDETAQSIGKFIGAQIIIIGQLQDISNTKRFILTAINVESAKTASISRFDVRNDRSLRTMINSLERQSSTKQPSNYNVTEQTQPRTIGEFIDRGILFATRLDFDLAILDFTEAIRLNPNFSSLYILRGRSYMANVSNVTSIDENFSNLILGGRKAGITDEQAEQAYNLALVDFTRAIQLEPNNSIAFRERGRVYNYKGNDDLAIADINQAIRFNPNCAESYNNRGLIYKNKNEFDRALIDYTQAIRIDPNFTWAYFNRGLLYHERGNYDLAISNFNQSIQLTPNHAASYLNRGNSYRDKGNNEQAINDYSHAIRLNYNYVNAYFFRGNIYFDLGNYDRAITDYSQAIRLSPNFTNAYINRGNAHQGKGNLDLALSDYNEAIKLSPNSTLAFLNRGNIYNKKGNNDLAISDYRQVIMLDPNNSLVYFNIGNIYLNKGDNDQAIIEYNQSIRLNPNYANAYVNRGNAYRRNGNINQAISDFETALRIDPNNNFARNSLNNTRQQQGR